MKKRALFFLVVLLIGGGLSSFFLVEKPTWDEKIKPADEKLTQLEGVGIEENLGEDIDLTLPFKDEDGNEVTLQKYFDGERPVFLSLIYYSCPSLCNFHLNGITEVLKNLQWTLGQEFDMVVVSIDPSEDPSLAKEKKSNYLEEYSRKTAAKGWHFLTGSQESITQLAKQVGFKYRWDEASEQWAHSAAAYVLTPQGKISRYLYGIQFSPKTLRLSLVEASNGNIGNVVDKFILYCFYYDPAQRKYALYAFNIMRAGASLSVILLGLLLVPFWWKQKKKPVV